MRFGIKKTIETGVDSGTGLIAIGGLDMCRSMLPSGGVSSDEGMIVMPLNRCTHKRQTSKQFIAELEISLQQR